MDIWGGPTGDPPRDWVEHTSEASHPWQDARVCTHKASLLGRSSRMRSSDRLHKVPLSLLLTQLPPQLPD